MKIGETGHIVDCNSTTELAPLIAKLLLDKDSLQSMGTAARTWVEKKFDWNALSYEAADIFGVDHTQVETCQSAPLEVARAAQPTHPPATCLGT